MDNNDFLQEIDKQFNLYKEELKKKEQWLDNRASWSRIFNNIARCSLILIGILVPFIIEGGMGEFLKGWGHYLTLVIAMIAALEGYFRWGEMWLHYRVYHLNLESAIRTYENARLAIHTLDDIKKRNEMANHLYQQFVDAVETMLKEETGEFFQKRAQNSEAKGNT